MLQPENQTNEYAIIVGAQTQREVCEQSPITNKTPCFSLKIKAYCFCLCFELERISDKLWHWSFCSTVQDVMHGWAYSHLVFGMLSSFQMSTGIVKIAFPALCRWCISSSPHSLQETSPHSTLYWQSCFGRDYHDSVKEDVIRRVTILSLSTK